MAKFVYVIGFATQDIRESLPEQVYLGKDPVAAQATIDASKLITFYKSVDGLTAQRVTRTPAPAKATKNSS